nr:uncharacterized protein LOC109163772 [Ipomoea trifida]
MRRMKYQGNDKASGSRTHDKDELQVLCYNCRKPGHFKAECPYPIVKKHQDEHNYKKNSGRYHHPKAQAQKVTARKMKKDFYVFSAKKIQMKKCVLWLKKKR